MEFVRRAGGSPARLGILAGAFHPPTRAHLALARAALDGGAVDEVLFVLPRRFPHKEYGAVAIADRLALLAAATAGETRVSIGVTEGGLFHEIAAECRGAYGEAVRLWFLCGRDAADRIMNWDYGAGPPMARQLERYGLLVAPRSGEYTPPPELAHAVVPLALDGDYEDVSSTAVRRRIRAGEAWEHLVPEAIVERVRGLYGA